MSGHQIHTIGAFFDGRPGHEKQTSGILEQLKKKKRINILPVQICRGTVAQQITDWMKYLFSLGGAANPDLADCDLLIGTGTHTHLPMLVQKAHFNMPVVTCMTPATFIQNKFDLILSPQHDNIVEKENVFRTVGPPNMSHDKGEHLRQRTLILVGGIDPQSHHWVNDEIIDCLKRLIFHEAEQQIIISSSPRTPVETVNSLAKLAEEFQHVSFFNYKDTPSGWVEEEYSLCEQVWVTGDSISMVYEALSSGCRVGIIPVRWRKQNSKFMISEKYLHDHEMVVDLHSYLAHEREWKDHPALDEASRCADEIINRFL
jgi:uncharacterized protein